MEINICHELKKAKKITVVGISDKPDRDSGRIALFLKQNGYEVTGVHPTINNVEDITVFKSISEVPGEIDILDIFLNPERINSIINEIIAKKPHIVWFQLGIRNDDAAAILESAGIKVVQDKCIAVEYRFCS